MVRRYGFMCRIVGGTIKKTGRFSGRGKKDRKNKGDTLSLIESIALMGNFHGNRTEIILNTIRQLTFR